MPTADGGPVNRKANKAAKRAKSGAGSKKAARVAAQFSSAFSGGGRTGVPKAEDYSRAAGYIVKGTDFLTFWPCDSAGYFYLSAPQLVNAKISQQYKFASPRPYIPMYAEVRVRYVNDSLTRGSRVFSRYVDVIEYVPSSRDVAKCRSPSRSALSNEMQRLDGFKPAILMP